MYRNIISKFYIPFQKFAEIISGISLPIECIIGRGLYIGHFGNVILSPDAQLGNNCNLSQGVTVGRKQRGREQGSPKIGNRVYIGPNAIVIGGISIEDDVAVGAGTVVTKSIPTRSVVVGNPGRIISENGSFEFVRYLNMQYDEDRKISISLRSARASDMADDI